MRMAKEETQQPIQNVESRGKVLMQWTFAENQTQSRGLAWYIAATIVGLAFLTYAILDHNYLFALMIILIAFIYYTQSRTTPLQLAFVLYSTGIQIGDTFYLYREFKDFAIIYEPPTIKRLYLHSKTMVLRNELSIPLNDQNPVKVRKILLDYLPEDLEMEKESGSDTATRVLKI